MIQGCKEIQKKHGSTFKGSIREREDLLMGSADDSRATLDFRDANKTMPNQTVTDNSTTTSPPTYVPAYAPPYVGNNTGYPVPYPYFPGYFSGYPQDISHVDLTTGTDTNRYDSHINYNLPYERPANFYDGKYDVYSSPVNPYYPGSYPSEQINEYADFHQPHPPEYQLPYSKGFKAIK